ncbi:MAG: hypothetical protein ISR25_02815 [Candidatus Poseidoniaceae archaeon]|nr:hypothetical protein [Candidatus Poseidoniaceae archaeon]MBL6889408.1 hypothetical protein [Candidatus Poseidoniaceae archaeon]
MNQSNSSTTAFYTLDGCISQNLDETFQALLKVRQGDSKLWQKLVKDETFSSRLKQQGLDEIDDRNMITWDDATLWFTIVRMLNRDSTPIMLGENKNRERFGRFPHHTGSSLQYILDNIMPVPSQSEGLYSDLVEHLEYLTERCSEMNTGHKEFREGKAGLIILGYITFEEVKSLRSMLLGSGWMVSREEPLDGGVRDAIRHLNALLMAAERRGAGLIHRQHE